MPGIAEARDKVLGLYLAFCRLFTAHCLEVRESTTGGEPHRQYRLRDGVDISMLEETERLIAARLDRFRSFHALISELGDELGLPPDELGLYPKTGGTGDGHVPPIDRVGGELRQILADALAYLPAAGC